MLKTYLRPLLPAAARQYLSRLQRDRVRQRVKAMPALRETRLRAILTDELGVQSGDVLFVHSSTDGLNLAFPFSDVLPLIRDVIGPTGTMLFPTYPRLQSYPHLLTGEVFDVRKSPSYTGLLTEFARRQRGAIRSLHPIKSVCAIGPHAAELTSTHQDSPYPYDHCSPYRKILNYRARIVGVGVSTGYLSFVHTVDDELKDEFPVQPYLPQLFEASCVDYDGKPRVVSTYAHNPVKMSMDLPGYMKKYVPRSICRDLNIEGMKFFTLDPGPLFDCMMGLARENITVYPRVFYKWRKLL